VLLVDDEPGFLEALQKRLSRRGLLVRMAPGGKEALELLEQAASDVVILDQKMPVMDGMDTLRRMRALYPKIKVIMLTGHATLDSAATGLALGAHDYLVKPCDLNTLLEQISSCLEGFGREEEAGDDDAPGNGLHRDLLG
jgi:DNA-binding NtrC family response regulator